MRSRIIRGIRARLRGMVQTEAPPPRSLEQASSRDGLSIGTGTDYRTAVDKFYLRLIKNNLPAFNSFALQSRSILARDVYAYAASAGRCDFDSLLIEADDILEVKKLDASILERVTYSTKVLLSLASYVLDTARSDLDTQAGVQIMRLVLQKYGEETLTDHHKMQFIEALAELRHYDEQDELIVRFDIESVSPMQAQLMHIDRIAKEGSSPAEWIEAMNGLYTSLEMVTIGLDDDSTLPLLDRLVSTTKTTVAGPKVSVIMPTFSPNTGIFTALGSLLQQTWSNIEIIVVDDGSPEGFDEILNEVENLDSRILVIRQQENGGAYVARNTGLAEATGEYVTTHDDDDWSHPEKLATQASALMADNAIAATTSAHIRTTQDMHFKRINSRPRHLQTNYSSLMFRKSVINQLGGWDSSNRGSDTELASRITQNFGKSSVIHFVDKPLSFSRVWAGSLTSGEVYRGYFTYSRLLYRWAFRGWHRNAKRMGIKPIMEAERPRPFAVPTTFEPGNRNKDLGVFDVIFVTDYSRHSKFVDSVLHQIEAAVSANLRVGYMHLNSPQTVKRAEIPSRLFEMQLSGEITQVADNNRAETKLMVIHDASIGMFLDEFKSSVVVQRGVVVDDKGALLRGAERREAMYPKTVLQHLDRSFDSYFQIVGAAKEEQETLRDQLPYDRLLDDRYIWFTHIEGESKTIRPPHDTPVVGFHSFGNKFRWPASREQFEIVYKSGGHESVFYGLLDPAKNALGTEIFADSREMKPQEYSLAEFFEQIDFWVYAPHERLIDRPWQAVLLALQAGKVVILPHRLEPVYGAAAVYAEPEEIASVVAEFGRNRDKYLAQAKHGQDVVAQAFDSSSYVRRLTELAVPTNQA